MYSIARLCVSTSTEKFLIPRFAASVSLLLDVSTFEGKSVHGRARNLALHKIKSEECLWNVNEYNLAGVKPMAKLLLY